MLKLRLPFGGLFYFQYICRMKEQYIKMKNSNKWDINWFYKYFLEHGGKAQPQEFATIFQQLYDLNTVIRDLDV